MVRRSTAAVTRTVASDIKGAALGVRDGLRHTSDNDAVDINSAPKSKLETLPGVTAVEASRIIEHRPYHHASDLVRRRILSKAVYDRIGSRLVAH